MKTYRILYWFSTSLTSEHYVKAANPAEAENKFRALKGDRRIIEIQEIE